MNIGQTHSTKEINMFNFSIPEISIYGLLVLATGFMFKEVYYDRKKLLNGKVGKEFCNEHRQEVNEELRYIRERVDNIYDILSKRRR
jgi:C4-dicarboxylate transporter